MAHAYTKYAQRVSATPQTLPIPGRESEMVQNNAGGYGFVLDDWERLMRFLVIGSDGGTYYTGEHKLTEENAACVVRCLKSDGPRVVEMARDVNVTNRAPKTDQQLFVLALAMKHGDLATKRAVASAAKQMLRTGTHLLHFVAMLDSLVGWSRARRRLIAEWFAQDPDKLAYQVLKYQNRDGWTQRDVLRLCHAESASPRHDAVLSWVTDKTTLEKILHMPSILVHHSAMNVMEGTPVEKALWGIERGIPREALPTEALTDLSVQAAMLPSMPLHALIRNLGNLTASGLLSEADATTIVVDKLVNAKSLRKARVHPFAVLLATLVYCNGRGVRGAKTWVPVPFVLSALEEAYDLAFDGVAPTNKRILVGIDVSLSMEFMCMNTPVSASTAAAAMALTLARLEPRATVITFDTQFKKIVPITKRTGIANIEEHSGGGTDLAAPVRWALENGRVFDAIVILTDNETWAGAAHTTQMLEQYRRSVNRQAKLACCAFTASHANVVDPQDALQFGCAGLDANLPSLVSDFIGS